MSKITAATQKKIDTALLNDGKIDAKEALAIAGAAKPSERADVAQALMDDGFTGSADQQKAVADKLKLGAMPSTDFKYSVQDVKQDMAIEHVEVDGVKFLIAEDGKNKVSPDKLKEIAKRVNENNQLIGDKSMQVKCVAIAPGAITRMATYQGKPMLVMDTKYADGATAAHESGHEVLLALKKSGKANDALLKVGDLYNQLMNTKQVNGTTVLDGKSKTEKGPSGMWPFDPPTWNKADKSATSEHPTANADEFFASAVAAWRTDRAGLEKAINDYAKKDPKGAAPAKEMLKLLDTLAANGQIPSPGLTGDAKTNAQNQVNNIGDPSAVEDTLDLHVGLSLTLKYGAKKP